MKYYFVSYIFQNGAGNAFVSRENLFILRDMIVEIEKIDPDVKKITIMNFFEVSEEMYLANTKPTQS